jgi:hypothetical protein
MTAAGLYPDAAWLRICPLIARPSSGQAGSGCGTINGSCPQTEYGCYGVSGIHHPPGATPVCQTESPNTP